VAIEGPLKELGLHDVFQLLDLSRKTGVLRITSHLRNNDGTVYFDHGAIVFAAIRTNPHRIGDRLVEGGQITPGELEHARLVQEREGGRRRLGQIFVEMGALTPRELQREVERHIEEAVFELLSWREGDFSFAEGSLAGAPADALVSLPTEKVLMEGARRIDEWSRIQTQVPHLGAVPLLAPLVPDAPAARLDLLPAEWEVLAELDGVRDLRQIAGALLVAEFEVARTVFGLVTTGVVVLRDPVAQRRPRPSLGDDADALVAAAEIRLEAGDVAAAKEAAQTALSLRPEEPRVHLVLARAHLAAGLYGEAVDACRRALRLAPELADAYRWCGFALVGVGRFRDARESWEQWERLVNGDADEAAHRQVADALAAAAALERALGGGGSGG
jgi:tetratricopeptide (TPR) repeat protein